MIFKRHSKRKKKKEKKGIDTCEGLKTVRLSYLRVGFCYFWVPIPCLLSKSYESLLGTDYLLNYLIGKQHGFETNIDVFKMGFDMEQMYQ